MTAAPLTLDVTVVATRRSFSPGMTAPDVDELFGPDSLTDVLGRSDIVVLAAPGTAENESMFDATTFAAMKPGSVFGEPSMSSGTGRSAL